MKDTIKFLITCVATVSVSALFIESYLFLSSSFNDEHGLNNMRELFWYVAFIPIIPYFLFFLKKQPTNYRLFLRYASLCVAAVIVISPFIFGMFFMFLDLWIIVGVVATFVFLFLSNVLFKTNVLVIVVMVIVTYILYFNNNHDAVLRGNLDAEFRISWGRDVARMGEGIDREHLQPTNDEVIKEQDIFLGKQRNNDHVVYCKDLISTNKTRDCENEYLYQLKNKIEVVFFELVLPRGLASEEFVDDYCAKDINGEHFCYSRSATSVRQCLDHLDDNKAKRECVTRVAYTYKDISMCDSLIDLKAVDEEINYCRELMIKWDEGFVPCYGDSWCFK